MAKVQTAPPSLVAERRSIAFYHNMQWTSRDLRVETQMCSGHVGLSLNDVIGIVATVTDTH